MSAHTPGPWEAHHQSDGCAIRPMGKGYLLAHLSAASFTYGANLQGGPPHDLAANANLIAAAPELLTALKRILSCQETDTHGIKYFAFDADSDVAKDALAAIAKAEGK